MKKQLAIAAGALLTLGTAVSASLNDYSQPTESVTSIQSTAIRLDSRQRPNEPLRNHVQRAYGSQEKSITS